MCKRTIYFIFIFISFNLSYSQELDSSNSLQMVTDYRCNINKDIKYDKERAYLFFTKGRQLIIDNQNNPFSKEFASGLECVTESVHIDTKNARYKAFLGDIYNILYLYDMPEANDLALNFYDEALDMDSSMDDIAIKAAILAIRSSLYKESLDYFEYALLKSEMHYKAEILDWMNIAYISIPQIQRGEEFYSKLLLKHPEADILRIYKAILMKERMAKKEAGDELLDIISNSKSNPKTVELAYKLLGEMR